MNDKTLSSEEVRNRFNAFWEKRGHRIVPSASLVPENDPTVLFNTAGMQPLVPYLLGREHPEGKRIANIQKCVRTVDIDDIGDNQVLQDILTCVGEQQQADKRNYNSVISRKCPEQLLQLPFSVATGDLQISDINPTDYIQTLELPTFTAAWLDAAVRRACMCVHEMSAPQAPS